MSCLNEVNFLFFQFHREKEQRNFLFFSFNCSGCKPSIIEKNVLPPFIFVYFLVMMLRVLSLIPTCIHWNDSVAENFLTSMLLFLFSNLVIDNWQFDLFLASLKYKFMKWASESGFFYRAWMFIHCLWAVRGNRPFSH